MTGARARRRGAWALLAVCAVGTGLTACAPPGDVAPPPLPDGVSVEFVQLRSDVAARQAQVQVHNDTDETIEIGDVTVTDPRFADVATRPTAGRSSTIAPGGTVDIRIQLPPMQCDTADGQMTVQLELDLPERAVRPEASIVEGPLRDPLDVVGPLHQRDCRAAEVADSAHVSFGGFDPSPPGEPATLTMSVAPTGRGAVTITGIQTTNLLTFGEVADATVETYPIGYAVREGDAGMTEIALPIMPLRCDPHAVQEDKRGTIFDVEVEIDGEPGEIELAASEDMRGEILTWVANWCGFGS
ncbi:hypothetical protein [Microbacterium sp. Root180]|uniref:hypothetical protein n=1 Tax=Microbacterium sp. Root180 TaxID=1736483 RepID=UPI000AEAB749|nr:hypothetical protein [Microbacterium sp. Root180]